MTGAYYNEHDNFAAAWLRELIKAGLIAEGEVDARNIQDVCADDVRGFVQCHFFAGIGGWSYALRLAGWPDDRSIWTGSCPCQPFSGAGKQKGGTDDRHLWPHWARLIRECRPVAIIGEQVESAIAHGWLDLVFDDLEREGYACGAACLPAGSVGAPHIRQRLWFVAESDQQHTRRQRRAFDGGRHQGSDAITRAGSGGDGVLGELADSERGAAERQRYDVGGSTRTPEGAASEQQRIRDDAGDGESVGELGQSDCEREDPQSRLSAGPQSVGTGSPWSDCDWLPCRDGKWRPVEPGTFPLAHGISGRVGRLRGYGNAIVPHVAAAFIEAYLEIA